MIQLVSLILLVVIIQLFVEDESCIVFAKLAVLLYVWQGVLSVFVYIARLFHIGGSGGGGI